MSFFKGLFSKKYNPEEYRLAEEKLNEIKNDDLYSFLGSVIDSGKSKHINPSILASFLKRVSQVLDQPGGEIDQEIFEFVKNACRDILENLDYKANDYEAHLGAFGLCVLNHTHQGVAEIMQDLKGFDSLNTEEIQMMVEMKEFQLKNEEKPLDTLREEFKNPESKSGEAPSEELLGRVCQLYEKICNESVKVQNFSKLDLENGLMDLYRQEVNDEYKIKFFAYARTLFKEMYGIYPYNTQVIASLLLIEQGNKDGVRGAYEQINTGEGKSVIFALTAMYFSLNHKRVHIITSDNQLAKRDAEKFGPLFKAIGFVASEYRDGRSPLEGLAAERSVITTSSNLVEKENLLIDVSAGSVLYTTTSDLAFSYLKEGINGKSSIHDSLDGAVVLIDEADNLCLDQLFSPFVISSVAHPCEHLFKPKNLKLILEIVKKFPCSSDDEILSRLEQDISLQSDLDRKTLQTLIHSARIIDNYKEGENYIIKGNKIVIIDKNTGRLKLQSAWQRGIRELLHIKHGVPISTPLVSSASISIPEYLKQYGGMYCITGTLGDKHDRDMMKSVFKITGFDIPPHKKRQRVDRETKYDENRINRLMLEVIYNHPNGEKYLGRPVLIIVDSIKDSEEIFRDLSKEMSKYPALQGYSFHLLNDYSNSAAEPEIIKMAGMKYSVTIATNIAGRGTDIKLTDEVKQMGGLHVILLNVPKSKRVEEQARGRAGRQGDLGTSIIVSSPEDPLFSKAFEICSDHPSVINNCIAALRGLDSIVYAESVQAGLAKEEIIFEIMKRYFKRCVTAKERDGMSLREVQEEWGRDYYELNLLIEEIQRKEIQNTLEEEGISKEFDDLYNFVEETMGCLDYLKNNNTEKMLRIITGKAQLLKKYKTQGIIMSDPRIMERLTMLKNKYGVEGSK